MRETNVVLVSMDAKYIHTNLAIRYLQKFCENLENVNISIREYTINQSRNYIISDLRKTDADLICFSCYIWNIEYIDRMSRVIKIAYGENIQIMFGGPEVSFEAAEVMKNNKYVDYIITGEGESTFYKFLSAYRDNTESLIDSEGSENDRFKNIKGLVYRNEQDGNEIIDNSANIIVEDIDEIPSPFNEGDDYTNKLVYYETSRGCPFNCSFCMSSVDKTVRYFKMDRVYRDLDILLKSNARTIKFIDRTFNANYVRAQKVIEYIIAHNDDNIKIHFEMNANIITNEFLKFMETLPRNMFQLEIGVQTTNEKTLDVINRVEDIDRLSNVVETLMSYRNIHVHVDLIAGLPYEDYKTFKKSFNEVHNLYADKLQLGFLKVLKGTSIYNIQAASGKILYDEIAPYEVIKTVWLSYDEILILKNIDTLVDKYYNEGYFDKSIKRIIQNVYGGRAYDFYSELNDYWDAKNLYLQKPSRKHLYSILVNFAVDRGWYTDQIKKQITIDYIENNEHDKLPKELDEYDEKDYVKIKRQVIEKNMDVLAEFFGENPKFSVVSANVRIVKILRDVFMFVYADNYKNSNNKTYSSEKNCYDINITRCVDEIKQERKS